MKISEMLWIADLMRLVLGKNITFLRRTFQHTHPTQRNHDLETCYTPSALLNTLNVFSKTIEYNISLKIAKFKTPENRP